MQNEGYCNICSLCISLFKSTKLSWHNLFSDYLTVNPLMGKIALCHLLRPRFKIIAGIYLLETSNPGASDSKAKDNNGQQLNVRVAEFIQKIHDKMGLKDNELGQLAVLLGNQF